MPGKLVIYRGLPGSGKTHLAESLVASHGGRLVGRDHIRKLMGSDHGWIFMPQLEDEVTDIQERLIVSGLRKGSVVHVDDMNLRSKYVRRLLGLAVSEDAEWRVEDLTYTSVELCIARDSTRVRPVGAAFIRLQYERFIKNKGWPLEVPEVLDFKLSKVVPEPYVALHGQVPVVLVDIDGTVALHDGIRGHHEYDKVHLDLPNEPVIQAVRGVIARGHFPVFVSGRPDSCREATRMWIHKHVGVGAYELLMRPTGDHRPDWLVKLEIFDNEIRTKYDVRMAFDDRDQVVRMYRELGLTVLQVGEGNF